MNVVQMSAAMKLLHSKRHMRETIVVPAVQDQEPRVHLAHDAADTPRVASAGVNSYVQHFRPSKSTYREAVRALPRKAGDRNDTEPPSMPRMH